MGSLAAAKVRVMLAGELNGLDTCLHGVSSHGGGSAGSGRARSLATRHQEELSKSLLHQASEALVVGVQGGAVYVLDNCRGQAAEQRRERRHKYIKLCIRHIYKHSL